MSETILSIVIPFKNTDRDKFSNLCNSIKLNDSIGVELVFVNDKSTEQNSVDLFSIVKNTFDDTEFKVKCITVPDNNVGGILQGRLYGYMNSSGNYLWGIDSDDELYNDSIDTLLYTISKYPNVDIITWKLNNSREKKYLKDDGLNWMNNLLDKEQSQQAFFKDRSILGYTHCKVITRDLLNKSKDELLTLGYINLAEDQIFSSYWFRDTNNTLLIPTTLYNYMEPDCSGKLQNIEPRFQLAHYDSVKNVKNAFKNFYDKYSKDLLIGLDDYDIYRTRILYSISRVPSGELCMELVKELIEEFGVERLKEYSSRNNNVLDKYL